MSSLLVVVVCLSPARAAEEDATVQGAVQAVIEAHDAKAADRLAALAARDHPDPWLVAEALSAAGKPEIAKAFATSAPRKAVASLPRYLASAPPAAEQAKDRAALDQAGAAWVSRDVAGALEALKERPATSGTVVAVRVHYLRGQLLDDQSKFDDSAKAYGAAADLAKALGWGAQESQALYHMGLAHWMRGRLNPVLEAFERRLDVETALESKAGMGRAHFGLATSYALLGKYQREADHLTQAQSLAEAAGDFEYLGKCLANAASIRARERDFETCLATVEKALKAFEQIDATRLATRFQPDPTSVAESRARALLTGASYAAALSDIEQARALARNAQTLAERAGSARIVALCGAQLGTLEAIWLALEDKDDEALSALENAFQLWSRAGDGVQAADTLRRIGAIHSRRGEFLTGLEKLDAALKVLTQIRAAAPLAYARMHAGSLNLRLGRTEEALAHLAVALRIARQLKNHQVEADTLMAFSDVYRRRGEYARSMQVLQEALRIQDADGRPSGRGRLLLHLGNLHVAMKEWGAAYDAMEKAQPLLEAGGDHFNLRVARAGMAGALLTDGRLGEAYEAFEALSAETEERGNRGARAHALTHMGLIRFRERRFADARALFDQARVLHEASGALDLEIRMRVAVAGARFWMGEKQEAIRALTAAHEAAVEKAASPQIQVDAASMLAEVYFRLENPDEAIRWARKGSDVAAGLGLRLSEEEGAGFRSRFVDLHQLGAAAAIQAGRIEDLYEFMERGRAATLLAALGGRAALRETTVPAKFRKAEDEARVALSSAQHEYEQARRTGLLEATRSRRADLEKAIGKLRGAVAGIERHARLQADLDYQTVTPLKEVVAGLTPDEAFVLYAEVLENTVALVVTKSGARPVDLGSSQQVAEAVQALLDDAEDPLNAAGKDAVRKLLLDPLKLDASTRRLLISPDGSLAYVPFSLLAGERDVALVPSGTTLGLLRTVDVTGGDRVLALGDPIYEERPKGAVPAPPILRGAGLSRLEGTGDEVREIGDDVYVRAEASESRFRNIVARDRPWRAVHLACHGVVDPVRPTLCALALTPDKAHDGFLLAHDVFRLRVPAELVVLSACDTGKGRVFAGEGMLGLTRAFMFAGAPRVLVSLWKVEDRATYALMTKFYELWNPRAKPGDPDRDPQGRAEGAAQPRRGMAAATALRLAQEHVKKQKKWSHPKYWAAWVLWGLPD